jgi:hypothetical protein
LPCPWLFTLRNGLLHGPALVPAPMIEVIATRAPKVLNNTDHLSALSIGDGECIGFRNDTLPLLAQSYGYAVLPTIGKGAWKHGMAIFILAKGGLMYEAVIAGQKYNFKPLQK